MTFRTSLAWVPTSVFVLGCTNTIDTKQGANSGTDANISSSCEARLASIPEGPAIAPRAQAGFSASTIQYRSDSPSGRSAHVAEVSLCDSGFSIRASGPNDGLSMTVGAFDAMVGGKLTINGGHSHSGGPDGPGAHLGQFFGYDDQTDYGQFVASSGFQRFVPMWDTYTPQPGHQEVVSGLLTLVHNGKALQELLPHDSETCSGTYARTLLGLTRDYKKLLVVAVEGPNGMTCRDAADYMVGLGAAYALNLDGGSSTQMLVDGATLVHSGDNEALGSHLSFVVDPSSIGYCSAATGNDFTGDAKGDPAVFRASAGSWYAPPDISFPWGVIDDVPIVGDYSGDGRADPAIFRPSENAIYINQGAPILFEGDGATNIPVPGDYNGDGTTDAAIFNPSTTTWVIPGQDEIVFGAPGDIPVPADYDGDQRTDIALFRPSNKTWYIQYRDSARPADTVVWGESDDFPVPGDYDGDGQADIATYDSECGIWSVKGFAPILHGSPGDIPIVADMNGDGAVDPTVYKPSNFGWYVWGQDEPVIWGQAEDVPVPVHPKGLVPIN